MKQVLVSQNLVELDQVGRSIVFQDADPRFIGGHVDVERQEEQTFDEVAVSLLP